MRDLFAIAKFLFTSLLQIVTGRITGCSCSAGDVFFSIVVVEFHVKTFIDWFVQAEGLRAFRVPDHTNWQVSITKC